MAEGHKGKNYWVIPQYARNVRIVNGEQVTNYTCQHCSKTLSGLNQHRLKQHLLNPSVCSFNLSAAAENCPAPEVQQMVLAMRYRSTYVNQPIPLPTSVSTIQLQPQPQEQQVHQVLQPPHQILQPQQHQQQVVMPQLQGLQLPQQPLQQQQQQQQQLETQPQQPTPQGRSNQKLMSQYADSVSASEKAELDVLFAKMMVEAKLPLTVLDSPAFQALFKRLRPAYKLPSKQDIQDINENSLDGEQAQRAGQEYGNQQEGMGEELEEEDLDD